MHVRMSAVEKRIRADEQWSYEYSQDVQVRYAFRLFTEVPMDEFDCYNKACVRMLR